MRPRLPLPMAFGAAGAVWGAWQAALPDLAGLRVGLVVVPAAALIVMVVARTRIVRG